jgi:hypothetical protein
MTALNSIFFSKPFDQLLTIWCLFLLQDNTPQSCQWRDFGLSSETWVQAVFSTCKIAKFDHNKNENPNFCNKMAISQEQEVGDQCGNLLT